MCNCKQKEQGNSQQSRNAVSHCVHNPQMKAAADGMQVKKVMPHHTESPTVVPMSLFSLREGTDRLCCVHLERQ